MMVLRTGKPKILARPANTRSCAGFDNCQPLKRQHHVAPKTATTRETISPPRSVDSHAESSRAVAAKLETNCPIGISSKDTALRGHHLRRRLGARVRRGKSAGDSPAAQLSCDQVTPVFSARQRRCRPDKTCSRGRSNSCNGNLRRHFIFVLDICVVRSGRRPGFVCRELLASADVFRA